MISRDFFFLLDVIPFERRVQHYSEIEAAFILDVSLEKIMVTYRIFDIHSSMNSSIIDKFLNKFLNNR